MNNRKKEWFNSLSYQDRTLWLSKGRITVGTVKQVNVRNKTLITSHTAKIRGLIINPADGIWKFDTAEDARKAGNRYKHNIIVQIREQGWGD